MRENCISGLSYNCYNLSEDISMHTKKQTVFYFIISAIPLLIDFTNEFIASYLDSAKINSNWFHFGNEVVVACVFLIANAFLCWLAHEKMGKFAKVMLWIMIVAGLLQGFIPTLEVTIRSGPYGFYEGMFTFAFLFHGMLLFYLYPRFRGSKIYSFLPLIIMVGLIVINIPIALLGYVNRFLGVMLPFILVLAVYIGLVRVVLRQSFGTSSSSYSSSSSSSSSKPTRHRHPEKPSDDYSSSSSESSLKKPDDTVGYMIASEIERRLPPTTPSTGLYCNCYSDGSAYLSGTIVLWHASDSGRIQEAVSDGFNAACEKAAREGYDVSELSLDPSDVSISAAGE